MNYLSIIFVEQYERQKKIKSYSNLSNENTEIERDKNDGKDAENIVITFMKYQSNNH